MAMLLFRLSLAVSVFLISDGAALAAKIIGNG
jgi:hypothetical protein